MLQRKHPTPKPPVKLVAVQQPSTSCFPQKRPPELSKPIDLVPRKKPVILNPAQPQWHNDYAQNLSDLVGVEKIVKNMNQFMRTKQKSLFVLHGPSGTGKSLVSKMVLESHGYVTREILLSEGYSYAGMECALRETYCLRSMRPSPPRALIVSELDVIGQVSKKNEDSGERKNCLDAIMDFYAKTQNFYPLFCVCNEIFNVHLRALRRASTEVRFFPLQPNALRNLYAKASLKFHFTLPEVYVQSTINKNHGDARQFLMDLQNLHDSGVKNENTTDTALDAFNFVRTLWTGSARLDITELDSYVVPLLFQNYVHLTHNANDVLHRSRLAECFSRCEVRFDFDEELKEIFESALILEMALAPRNCAKIQSLDAVKPDFFAVNHHYSPEQLDALWIDKDDRFVVESAFLE